MRSVFRGLIACPWLCSAIVIYQAVHDGTHVATVGSDADPVEVGDEDVRSEPQREEFYPATWNQSLGSPENVVAMDAILFPDPMAPPDVFESARMQCIEGPHVVIIGNAARGWGDDEFRCAFHDGLGGQILTLGRRHPPPKGGCNIPGLHTPRKYMNGPLLACRVPSEALAKYSATRNSINVTFVHWNDTKPMSSIIQVSGLWSNGVNEAATTVRTEKYRLAIHHMYRNTGAKIVNWIEWHIAKGVEHFFLYDNNSEEDDAKYLEPYERQGLVTRIRWPFCCKGTENSFGQRFAMNHALFKYGQVSDWIISLDADEFLITDVRSVVDRLDRLFAEDNRFAFVGVAESWIMQPGCADAFGPTPALKNGSYMGSIMVSTTCPPKMTYAVYPGKYFVKTLAAYRIGFTYVSPHPEVLPKTSISRIFDGHDPILGIAHFRNDYAKKPTEQRTQDTTPLYRNFIDEFRLFAPTMPVQA